jgi:hypothetical protein
VTFVSRHLIPLRKEKSTAKKKMIEGRLLSAHASRSE